MHWLTQCGKVNCFEIFTKLARNDYELRKSFVWMLIHHIEETTNLLEGDFTTKHPQEINVESVKGEGWII